MPGHHRVDFLQIRQAAGFDDVGRFPEQLRPDERRRHGYQRLAG